MSIFEFGALVPRILSDCSQVWVVPGVPLHGHLGRPGRPPHAVVGARGALVLPVGVPGCPVWAPGAPLCGHLGRPVGVPGALRMPCPSKCIVNTAGGVQSFEIQQQKTEKQSLHVTHNVARVRMQKHAIQAE